MSTVYFFPIVSLVCGAICYSMAKKRNLNVPLWVVMGALFGPLAIPFLYFSKTA